MELIIAYEGKERSVMNTSAVCFWSWQCRCCRRCDFGPPTAAALSVALIIYCWWWSKHCSKSIGLGQRDDKCSYQVDGEHARYGWGIMFFLRCWPERIFKWRWWCCRLTRASCRERCFSTTTWRQFDHLDDVITYADWWVLVTCNCLLAYWCFDEWIKKGRVERTSQKKGRVERTSQKKGRVKRTSQKKGTSQKDESKKGTSGFDESNFLDEWIDSTTTSTRTEVGRTLYHGRWTY
jgi:hypothetical protein